MHTKIAIDVDVGNVDVEILTAEQMKSAVESALALQKHRVFMQQKKADGTRTGEYSTKPISILGEGAGTGYPEVVPRGGAPTKEGRKSPKTHKALPAGKWMRFKGGYQEFRDKAGRQAERRDYTLSGTLMRRYRVLAATDHSAVCGWPAGSTQALAAMGADELEGGKLWSWADKERKAIVKALQYFVSANFAAAGLGDVPVQIDLVTVSDTFR